MKRRIASRKLKVKCCECNCGFKKGDVYYKKRHVASDETGMFAHDTIFCARCKYKLDDRERRFGVFKTKCEHPAQFVELVWCYIPGEVIMAPDYEVCRLCQKIV